MRVNHDWNTMNTLPNFAFCVPVCFEGSISQRNFQVGDILYDTPNAYEVWSTALQHIRYALQVNSATAGRDGRVAFSIFCPNDLRTALVRVRSATLTQDAFIALLRSGNMEETESGDTTEKTLPK
jgi:hypothetical protein